MKYNQNEMPIKIYDAAADARGLYGKKAKEVIGLSLRETDYRSELTPSNSVKKKTFAFPASIKVSAEDVLAYLNR